MRSRRAEHFDEVMAETRCALQATGMAVPQRPKDWDEAMRTQAQHIARQMFISRNPKCLDDSPDQLPCQDKDTLHMRTECDERNSFPMYDLPEDIAEDLKRRGFSAETQKWHGY